MGSEHFWMNNLHGRYISGHLSSVTSCHSHKHLQQKQLEVTEQMSTTNLTVKAIATNYSFVMTPISFKELTRLKTEQKSWKCNNTKSCSTNKVKLLVFYTLIWQTESQNLLHQSETWY